LIKITHLFSEKIGYENMKGMLKISFVIPTDKYNYKPFRNQPLVALYLLTIIEERFGKKVELSLVDLRGVKEECILEYIPESDLFLYSVTTPEFNEIAKTVKNIRRAYPNAKHIAGGPHVNILPEESSNTFDTIVLGEGEESIIKIIGDYLKSSLKTTYKHNGYVDLNSYPYPSRKYLPKTAVVEPGLLCGKYLNLNGTSIIFSRGCPFNCYFCANKKLTFGPPRYRSPELMIEEIEYLKREYQIEALALKDDNSIPLDPKITRSFLEAIQKTNIKWRGQSRANGVHPDMVKLAWESGCTDIAMGVESASSVALKLLNKNINLDKAKEYICILNKTGIGVRLHFIIGLPGEGDDIVKRTLDFINETNPRSVLLSILCPMPGSEIYDFPNRFGIKLDNALDWSNYYTAFARFDPTELPMMVFNYDQITPWGKGKTKEKILADYLELQSILRERKLNF